MSVLDQVRLANDVSAQFHHLPRDEAVAAVLRHLRLFWEPRMRAQLVAHVDSGGAGLDPLALAAATSLR